MDGKNNQNESLNRVNTPDKEEKESKGKRQYFGQLLVTSIVCFVSFQYYIYVYEIMYKSTTNKTAPLNITFLIIFHFLLFMLLWSLMVTMNTHPGEIPLYWVIFITYIIIQVYISYLLSRR